MFVLYAEHKTGVTFDDVAGIDEPRGGLMEVVDFLKNPDRHRRLDGKIAKGVLIISAPGTGTTLLAKAEAQEKAPSIIFIDELDALGEARGVVRSKPSWPMGAGPSAGSASPASWRLR